MEVRPHLSQHETVQQLPFVTESARVRGVAALDGTRADVAMRAVRETLDDHGTAAYRRQRPADDDERERWLRERLDEVQQGTPLNRYLPKWAADRPVGRALAVLQSRYLRPYPSLVAIGVETDTPVEFVPGQYVALRYEGTTRVYSVASPPEADDLEFCVRRVPSGRLTPDLATGLSAGDTVRLRGPYGDFVMHPPSSRDLIFLATGTGVAPLRSMIDHCFATGRDEHGGRQRDVWLFLGAAWEDDLAYREHFRALDRERDNFHFVPTLSRETHLTDWAGETAYVQHTLVKYLAEDALSGVDLPRAFEQVRENPRRTDAPASLDPARMEVYACGINAMVYGLVDAVERLGVPERHVEFEGFG
jgi:CDP-4-dehydro-6-deoxyglucose reductase